MNLHEALISRRTVHDFTDEPLPPEVLRRALQAGIAAPNHRMTEPWRFVQVGPRARLELLKIAFDLKAPPGQPLTESAQQRLRDKFIRPPGLLAVIQQVHPKAQIEREDFAAVSCAIGNAMLSLWGEGWGSKWSTGGVTTDPRTTSLLGVDEASQRVVGFLWIGRAAGSSAVKPPRRKAIEDLLKVLD